MIKEEFIKNFVIHNYNGALKDSIIDAELAWAGLVKAGYADKVHEGATPMPLPNPDV